MRDFEFELLRFRYEFTHVRMMIFGYRKTLIIMNSKMCTVFMLREEKKKMYLNTAQKFL